VRILINGPQILESLIATLMMDNRFGILNKEKIKENLEILLNKRISTIKKKKKKKSIIWHLTLVSCYNLEEMKIIRYNSKHNSIYLL
jgi:hypothetical protein